MKFNLYLFLLFLGFSSNIQAQTIQEWLIDSKQLPCKDNANKKCFIIKKKDSNNWEYLDAEINGLIYYEGFVYFVQVVIEEPTPGAKAYSLLKIIERSKSTPQFLLNEKDKKTIKEIVPLDFVLNTRTFRITKLNNFTFNGDKLDPYIKFVQGRLEGSTGCNRFKSNCKIEYDSCSFTGMMMTKMACMDKRGEVESQFRKAILTTAYIENKDTKLVLMDNKRNILAEFIEKK